MTEDKTGVSEQAALDAAAECHEELSAEEQQVAAGIMFEYLKDVLYNPRSAQIEVEELPEAFQNLGAGLQYIGQCLLEARELANDIAKGRLNTNPLSPGNELASGLKNLQATLKHLTWQLGQVAKGDYKQRVSFVGEFSEAINDMIYQLHERDAALQTEITLNLEKNEELQQIVSLFEAITSNMADWIIIVDKESREFLYYNHPPEMVLHSMAGFKDLKRWIDYQIERVTQEEEQQLKEQLKEQQLKEEQLKEQSKGQPKGLPKGQPIEDQAQVSEPAEEQDKVPAKVEPHMLEFSYVEDDQIQFFTVARFPISWHDHKTFAFVMTDATEEKQMRDELEAAAYYDALTGSYSRHYGMNLFEKWLAQKEAFIVAFVDMDSLKYVNDTYGHNEGDAYIIDVTRHLKNFDDHAILSRLGGDEFMVLCKGCLKEDANQKLEQIRQDLIDGSGEDYLRSISYGVIEVTESNDKTGSFLLSIADEIMYDYKRARKIERRSGK